MQHDNAWRLAVPLIARCLSTDTLRHAAAPTHSGTQQHTGTRALPPPPAVPPRRWDLRVTLSALQLLHSAAEQCMAACGGGGYIADAGTVPGCLVVGAAPPPPLGEGITAALRVGTPQ